MTDVDAQESPTQGPDLAGRLLLDTSETEPVYMITGSRGTHLRLSPSAYHLLRLREEGASFEDISEAIRSARGETIPPEEIEAKHDGLLRKIEELDQKDEDPIGYLFRIRLLPAALVGRWSALLERAFAPGPVAVAVLIVTAALWYMKHLGMPAHTTPWDFGAAYLLFVFSMLIHELGHASACAHYGAAPDDIGATLYLIYPAFYSDVSAAWELSRFQRVVVDLGGTYFQFVVAAAFTGLYALTDWAPLGLAVFMILGVAAFSLNPIFRFDGYWIVSDALGVTNLGHQPGRIVKHYWNRLRGKEAARLPWSPRMLGFLGLYTVATFAFWGFILWRIGPGLVRRLMGAGSQIEAYSSGRLSLSALLMSFAMTALLVFIGWRLLSRFVQRPWESLVRRLGAGGEPHREDSPAPETEGSR